MPAEAGKADHLPESQAGVRAPPALIGAPFSGVTGATRTAQSSQKRKSSADVKNSNNGPGVGLGFRKESRAYRYVFSLVRDRAPDLSKVRS